MAKKMVDISAAFEDVSLCSEAETILLDWLRSKVMLETSYDIKTRVWHHTAILEMDFYEN